MTSETTVSAVETIASTVPATKTNRTGISTKEYVAIGKKLVAESVAKKTAKPTTKKVVNMRPVIKARPAPKMPKTVKSVAKKAVKAAAVPRAQHTFTLSPKADMATFGSGQRFEIAKLIKKGATRTDLIAKLPNVSAANISWHLSMMVKNGEAKKTAAK